MHPAFENLRISLRMWDCVFPSPAHPDPSPETHSFLFLESIPFISGDCSRPQTTNVFVLLLHLVGFAWQQVPKVDVKHVKCYLPHLLGRWIFMSLSTSVSFPDNRRRPPESSNRLEPLTCYCRHPSRSSLHKTYLFVFRTRWWFFLKMTIAFCSNLCPVHEDLHCIAAITN